MPEVFHVKDFSETLYPTAEAAQLLGVSPCRVRQLMDEHGLGRRLLGRRFLRPNEMELLLKRNKKVGNPNFGPGYVKPKKEAVDTQTEKG